MKHIEQRISCWSANMLTPQMNHNAPRHLQSSRLSTARPQSKLSVITNEDKASGSKLPPEVKNLTTLIQNSDNSQREYLLNYLKSLTNILEDQVIDTNPHLFINPAKSNTRVQPNLSNQVQLHQKTREHAYRYAPPTAMADATISGLKVQIPSWPDVSNYNYY